MRRERNRQSLNSHYDNWCNATPISVDRKHTHPNPARLSVSSSSSCFLVCSTFVRALCHTNPTPEWYPSIACPPPTFHPIISRTRFKVLSNRFYFRDTSGEPFVRFVALRSKRIEVAWTAGQAKPEKKLDVNRWRISCDNKSEGPHTINKHTIYVRHKFVVRAHHTDSPIET